MRRVLPQKEFAKWLRISCRRFPTDERKADWLPVAVSPDPSDPKLAHLDGLNLSRAWMLEGILSAFPADDPRRARSQRRPMRTLAPVSRRLPASITKADTGLAALRFT